MALDANDFTPVTDKDNEWVHKDGTRYVGRHGQTLAALIAEVEADRANGE